MNLEEALAAIERVRALHSKSDEPDVVPEWIVENYSKTREEYCLECFKAYPCVTIRALGGEQG